MYGYVICVYVCVYVCLFVCCHWLLWPKALVNIRWTCFKWNNPDTVSVMSGFCHNEKLKVACLRCTWLFNPWIMVLYWQVCLKNIFEIISRMYGCTLLMVPPFSSYFLSTWQLSWLATSFNEPSHQRINVSIHSINDLRYFYVFPKNCYRYIKADNL